VLRYVCVCASNRRTNLPAGLKTASWDARVEKRKKEEAIKLMEKTLRDETIAEEERYVPRSPGADLGSSHNTDNLPAPPHGDD
jgi:hypothetical protein